MADQAEVVRAGRITTSTLRHAYSFISRVLEENKVRATCAFVSAFAVGREGLADQAAAIRELAKLCPAWFGNICHAIDRDELDGWIGDEFHAMMAASGHEIGWHGATHLSLADATPDATIELELALAERFFLMLGKRPLSIVFPRNEVGHLDRLLKAGFSTYRQQPPPGQLRSALRLAREWHVRDSGSSSMPQLDHGWTVSPAGFFLNWPSGIRSLVSPETTIRRWNSMLEAAVARGGYVHMWFHPHNLITAPGMQDTFEAVIRRVGQLAAAGQLLALPMSEASAWLDTTASGEHRDH